MHNPLLNKAFFRGITTFPEIAITNNPGEPYCKSAKFAYGQSIDQRGVISNLSKCKTNPIFKE